MRIPFGIITLILSLAALTSSPSLAREPQWTQPNDTVLQRPYGDECTVPLETGGFFLGCFLKKKGAAVNMGAAFFRICGPYGSRVREKYPFLVVDFDTLTYRFYRDEWTPVEEKPFPETEEWIPAAGETPPKKKLVRKGSIDPAPFYKKVDAARGTCQTYPPEHRS